MKIHLCTKSPCPSQSKEMYQFLQGFKTHYTNDMQKEIIKCGDCLAHYPNGNLHTCDRLMKGLMDFHRLQEEFLRESNAIEGVFDQESLKQAMTAWMYLRDQKKLTTGVMLRTHKILMLNQPLMPDQRGYFRKVPVWIGGHLAMPWEKIDAALDNLIMNMMDVVNAFKRGNENSPIFLERLTREHHVQYEKIHPFVDGNGRTGRMFLNWQRLKVGLPILIIKASESQEYYKWFK